MRAYQRGQRRRPRWTRRLRRWWRETPTVDIARTLMAVGLICAALVALMLYMLLR